MLMIGQPGINCCAILDNLEKKGTGLRLVKSEISFSPSVKRWVDERIKPL
jgi:hypothetical protein